MVNPTPNACFQKRPMKLGMVSLGFTTCPLQLPFSLPRFLDSSSAVQPPNVWTSGFLAGESSFLGFLRFLNHFIVISPLKNNDIFIVLVRWTSLSIRQSNFDGISELPPFDEPQNPSIFSGETCPKLQICLKIHHQNLPTA